MSSASFDAAEKTGAAVQVDLRSLIMTIFPGAGIRPTTAAPLALQPDGDEDWGDVDTGVFANHLRKRQANPRFGERIRASLEAKPKNGPGGYPIINDPDNPLKQWYDKLGFDPPEDARIRGSGRRPMPSGQLLELR